MYHLRQGYNDIKDLPVFERKWMIDRFIEQKNREEESMKKAQKNNRGSSRRGSF